MQKRQCDCAESFLFLMGRIVVGLFVNGYSDNMPHCGSAMWHKGHLMLQQLLLQPSVLPQHTSRRGAWILGECWTSMHCNLQFDCVQRVWCLELGAHASSNTHSHVYTAALPKQLQ